LKPRTHPNKVLFSRQFLIQIGLGISMMKRNLNVLTSN